MIAKVSYIAIAKAEWQFDKHNIACMHDGLNVIRSADIDDVQFICV